MCCLFGLIDSRGQFSAKEKSRILSVLATECEERGTDATGIAYCSHRHLSIYKCPIAAHRMRFRIPTGSRVIMGHTRMTIRVYPTETVKKCPIAAAFRILARAKLFGGFIGTY